MLYTERRGSVFWFRRRAPAPLVAGMKLILGDLETTIHQSGYVRFSLKTGDRREAGKLARQYAHFLDQAATRREKAQAIANGVKASADPAAPLILPSSSAPLSREDIQYAADSLYAQLLGADDAAEEHAFQDLLNGEDEASIRPADRYSWSSADLPPQSPTGQLELIQKLHSVINYHVMMTCGKQVTSITAELLPFAHAFRRYVAVLEKRRASEHAPTPSLPTKSALWTWEQALAYYVSRRDSFKSESAYALAWFSLRDSANCTPADLSPDQVVDWRDAMQKTLAPRTAKVRLTFAGAIWRESKVSGKIDRQLANPFEGLRVLVNEKERSSRKEFTHAELVIIFAAAPVQTLSAVSIHAGYWLPLLALYSGARLEELTGLEVADILESPTGLLLRIVQNEIRPHLKHGRHSERTFPVPPKVLELGFEHYVETARQAQVKALFPSFAASQTFGEAFVAHVKSLISVGCRRLVGMHCFRHTFQTESRDKGIHQAAANYIAGRVIEAGSAALYGSHAGYDRLRAELSKMDFGLHFLPPPAVTADELRAQENRCVRARQEQRRRKDMSVLKQQGALAIGKNGD